jgi:hypothetical protein
MSSVSTQRLERSSRLWLGNEFDEETRNEVQADARP